METLSYIGAVLTIASFLPQALKTIKTRQTRDLSLPTYLLLLSGSIIWALYGVEAGSIAIVITNSVVAISSSVILYIKISEK